VCFAVSFAAATDKIAVRCDLETRIIGKTQSAEQSASQRLESLAHAPAGIKDLPSGLGKDVRFFLIRIGDKDRPIIVDVREGRQTTFILYADINGNGRLSDEKPYTAKPIPSAGSAMTAFVSDLCDRKRTGRQENFRFFQHLHYRRGRSGRVSVPVPQGRCRPRRGYIYINNH
jgi:hypothetical protein